MKKGNTDDWSEDVVEKAINAGKLYELLFSETGKKITAGHSRKKLQTMVKRAFKKGQTYLRKTYSKCTNIDIPTYYTNYTNRKSENKKEKI